MPDEENFKQIQMVANVISSLPSQHLGGPRIPLAPPMVAKWAAELVNDFGVRIHPELATKTLEMGDTDGAGNFTPKRVEDVVDLDGLREVLRSFDNVPSLKILADMIDEAGDDSAKRAAVLQHIRNTNPDVIKSAEQIRKRAAERGEFG